MPFYYIWCNYLKSKVLKQLLSIVLLFAFLLQMSHRLIIIVDFKVNNEQYLQNCENKSRPEMACKGRCQMTKKVQEEEQKEQQLPETKLEKTYDLFFVNIHNDFQYFNTTPEKSYFQLYCVGQEIKMSRTHFRPPIS